MRAIIVEDEPYSLLLNKQLLSQSGEVDIIGAYAKPREAIAEIIQSQPDVLFVDIEMPMMNGFQLLDMVRDQVPHMEVIIITSYDHYALKAFDVDAVDYLLKPLTEQQVSRLIHRLKRHRMMVQDVPGVPHQIETAPFHTRLFGDFHMQSGDVSIDVRWLTAKSEEVFFYLMLQPEFTVKKEQLLQDIWPNVDEESALINLHTAIYRMKKSLLQTNVPIKVDFTRGKYQLICEHVRIDKTIFDQSQQGWPAELQAQLIALEQWVELHRGPLLSHRTYDWLTIVQDQYSLKYVDTFKQMLVKLQDVLKEDEVEKYILRVLAVVPEDEQLNERLMTMYFNQERRTAFIRCYLKFKSLLHEGYGIEPNERVKAMYQKISKSM